MEATSKSPRPGVFGAIKNTWPQAATPSTRSGQIAGITSAKDPSATTSSDQGGISGKCQSASGCAASHSSSNHSSSSPRDAKASGRDANAGLKLAKSVPMRTSGTTTKLKAGIATALAIDATKETAPKASKSIGSNPSVIAAWLRT